MRRRRSTCWKRASAEGGRAPARRVRGRRRAGLRIAGVAVVLAGCLSASSLLGLGAAAIKGERPRYGPVRISASPNPAAVVARIWVPALDRGFDPQGLAIARGSLWISGYLSFSFRRHRGPCRVFQVDADTGRVQGRFALPPPCGHAGGLASAGGGVLYVADAHALYAVALDSVSGQRTPVFRRFPLGPGVTGALAASAPEAIWLGTYREGRPGRIYRFDRATLDRLRDGQTVTTAMASATLAIPSEAQGAALGPDGKLRVARSGLWWGDLVRLDATSGAVEARHAIASGTEGIAFDAAGRLWAVSEAGVRHYYDFWGASLISPFHPLIYALDPSRLR